MARRISAGAWAGQRHMPQGFEEAPVRFVGADAEAAAWLRLDQLDRQDTLMRMAAFEHVRELSREQGLVRFNEQNRKFSFQGERYFLFSQPRGIFKPKEMRFLLSIKTVSPRAGKRVWYDDQRDAHRQIYEGDELVDYSFTGDDPDATDNRNLKIARDYQIPLIYFLGISPGLYQIVAPVFVADVDRSGLRARIAFALPDQTSMEAPSTSAERRYALRLAKQRLHQDAFREAVLTAYQGRCALSGLPEPKLLDAAHIMADAHELLGQPIVPNGLPLSKTHHAAFDSHLIGIDGDRRIHVSKRLMSLSDGPVLESMKQLQGAKLRDPKREEDLPDRNRLAERFELFKAAA